MANTLLYSEIASSSGEQYRIDLIGDTYAGLNDDIQSYTASSVTIDGNASALLSIGLAINVIDDDSVSPNIATTVASFSYNSAANTTLINLSSGTVDANHDRVTTTNAPSFEVVSGGDPLKTTWDGEGDEILEPLKSSTTEWVFYNRNASGGTAVDYWINRYKYDPENEWYLKVQKWNGASYDLFWVGNVINDNVSWENVEQPPVTIKAIDGIGRLNDLQFDDAVDGTITTDLTLLDYINRILDYNNLEQFWGATDIYIEESIEYTAGTSIMNATNGPLENTRSRPEVFIDTQEIEEIRALSCGECLKAILELFRARIMHVDGKYVISQVRNYDSATYNYRAFYKGTTSAPDATGSRTHAKTLGGATAGKDLRTLAGSSFSYLPGLYRASTNIRKVWGARVPVNLDTYNTKVSTATGAVTKTMTLYSVLGGTANNAVFELRINPKNVSTTGASGGVPYLEIKLNLNDGTNYLRQTYGGTPKWTTTSTDRAEERFYNSTDRGVVIIKAPSFPGTSTTNYTASFTYTVKNSSSLDEYIVELVRIYLPVSTGEAQGQEVYIENPTSGFSKELVLKDLLWYDKHFNGTNVLEVRTGTSPDVWAAAGATWVGGFGTSSNFLSKLGVLEAMGVQSRPLETFSGMFEGAEYLPDKTLSYNYKTYVMNGCTFGYKMDEWSGTWFEIYKYTATFDPSERYDPKGGNEGGQSESTRQMERYTNNVSNYRELTRISGDLASGTITSINIVATGHTRIKDGDTIFLIHPYTGKAVESFEVSADVSAVATSISVTSKATSDTFPNGCYVVHNPAEVVQSAIGRFDTLVDGSGNEYISELVEVTVTTSSTLAATSDVANVTANEITVTLPTLASRRANSRKILYIINDSGGDITIDGNGSETIMGSTTAIMGNDTSFSLYPLTTDWKLI